MLTQSNSTLSSSHSAANDSNSLAGQLQQVQAVIGRAQSGYSDSDTCFWALGLAWEAVRLAWYELTQGHPGDKLRNVENALNDYKRIVEASRS